MQGATTPVLLQYSKQGLLHVAITSRMKVLQCSAFAYGSTEQEGHARDRHCHRSMPLSTCCGCVVNNRCFAIAASICVVQAAGA